MKPASEKAKELMSLLEERNKCGYLYGATDVENAITEARREAVNSVWDAWTEKFTTMDHFSVWFEIFHEEVCGK